MSEDDVLFGYRLRLFDLAARTTVTEACRVFGIHRSTYYGWKRRIERHGLEILRPRERRRPRQPNQLSPLVEERIVAFALGHPGLGPKRIAAELGRERWGGLVVSHNGVWRCLKRHGLNRRSKRLSLVAGYAAPYEPPRQAQPKRHVEAEKAGELVGMDSFYVGRLAGTRGAVWQLTAIDIASSFAWAELVSCPRGNPTGEQTSKLAGASPPSSKPPAGSSSACSPTMAASIARPASAPRSRGSTPATPSSAPAAPRPTATSKRSTAPSSRSAGAPPSHATYKSASPASNATSTTTSTTTTTSAPTPAASPKDASPPRSSTVPPR
jgi:transposase